MATQTVANQDRNLLGLRQGGGVNSDMVIDPRTDKQCLRPLPVGDDLKMSLLLGERNYLLAFSEYTMISQNLLSAERRCVAHHNDNDPECTHDE